MKDLEGITLEEAKNQLKLIHNMVRRDHEAYNFDNLVLDITEMKLKPDLEELEKEIKKLEEELVSFINRHKASEKVKDNEDAKFLIDLMVETIDTNNIFASMKIAQRLRENYGCIYLPSDLSVHISHRKRNLDALKKEKKEKIERKLAEFRSEMEQKFKTQIQQNKS